MHFHPNHRLLLFSSLFVWGACLFLWLCYGKPITGIDDANIYQVYMRNLAEGHGFVYQVGGEKVEGFTSVLWVLIGACVYRWLIAPELVLILLSVLIVNALIVVLNHQLNRLYGQEGFRVYHLFFMLLLLFVPGYFDWTLFTLMETALWSLLLTLLALRVSIVPAVVSPGASKDNLILSILLVLLLLTRPESMLWGPLLLALRIGLFRYSGYSWRDVFRYNLFPVMVFGTALISLILWRLWYFGYPFPNTYYAKVSSQPWGNLKTGARYLIEYILHFNPLVLLMYGLSAGWMYQFSRLPKPDAKMVTLLVWIVISLLNLFFPLLTGGDHFYLGRILQPLMPMTFMIFTYLFFQIIVVKLDAAPARILLGAQAGLLLVTAMLLPDQYRFYRYGNVTPPFQYEFYLAQKGREMGHQMNNFFYPVANKPVWGVLCAGGIAYSYDGVTLDLLGLNNVAMAHANPVKPADRPKNHGSFDKEVFYTQQPDIMYPTQFVQISTFSPGPYEQSDTFQNDFFARATDHIHQDPRFKSLYVPVLLTSKAKGDVLYAYFRRRYLEQLDLQSYELKYLSE